MERFPTEIVTKIFAFTCGMDLSNLSRINTMWYKIGRNRREEHRSYRSRFGALSSFLWRDTLWSVLRNPWIIPYITELTIDFIGVGSERRLLSGAKDPKASTIGDEEFQILRRKILDSPTSDFSFLDFHFKHLQRLNNFHPDDLWAHWQDPDVCNDPSTILFLIMLLTHLRYLDIKAFSAMSAFSEDVLDMIARMASHTSSPLPGRSGATPMSDLQYIKYEGEPFSMHHPKIDSDFLVPFMTLPRVKAMQLVHLLGHSFTPALNLPLSSLTNLILLNSPFKSDAVATLLAMTPYLQRFVCLNHLQERTLTYDVAGYIRALADSPTARHSFQFLALDPSTDSSKIRQVTDKDVEGLQDLSGFRTLYVHSGFLPPIYNTCLAAEASTNLRVLAVSDMLDSCSAVRFVRGLIGRISCYFAGIVVSICGCSDSDLLREREQLLVGCEEVGLTPMITEHDFRMEIVAGMNEKWKLYT